jgi:hypothetical protein
MLAAAACNKSGPEPAPQVTPSAETKPTTATPVAAERPAEATKPAHPSGAEDLAIEWADPPGWKRGPERPMRKATYAVPKADGDAADGELAVFYFGAGQGGDVEANVKRWTAQFADVSEEAIQRSERSVNDIAQHIVEVPDGTYTNSMAMHGPRTPQEHYALLGAVVQAPSGNYFFKLTGPSKTVKANKDAFYALLDSIKPKQ